jgi:hypothetical protein
LGEIAHAPQQPVGYQWRRARARREFDRTRAVNSDREQSRALGHPALAQAIMGVNLSF